MIASMDLITYDYWLGSANDFNGTICVCLTANMRI